MLWSLYKLITNMTMCSIWRTILYLFVVILQCKCQVKQYHSCMDVKKDPGTNATDGEYIIYLRWKKNVGINVYCAFLQATDRGPQSFLTLPEGRAANFATIYGNLGESTGCADMFPRTLYGEGGRTEFSRISLDPLNLQVDITDFTFSNSSGTNRIPYGTAGDYYTSSIGCTPMGLFQIDLTGTPFTISKDTEWSGVLPTNSTYVQINDNSYLGCFADKKDRLLPGIRRDSLTNQSVEYCTTQCRKYNYDYAGVEYGVECHCGRRNERFGTTVSENYCDKPCSGNSSQICGGTWYASIYKTGLSQKRTGRCGGYPGQCLPTNKEDKSRHQLTLDIAQHRCIKRNPCQNEGRCIALTLEAYKCVCYDGYTGSECRTLNSRITKNGSDCPTGYQAESCRCVRRVCAGARFEGDVCKTLSGNPQVICRKDVPVHVMLFNKEGFGSVRCPTGSERVGCTFWNNQSGIHYLHGHYVRHLPSFYGQAMYKSNNKCAYRSSTAAVQIRCKKYLCGCQNGGHCNKVTGQCECKQSYYGTKCEKFDYCSYYEDTHNNTSPCTSSGICTPVHKTVVATHGGDKAGDSCLFPFDWGKYTYNTCVKTNEVGPPFACAGEFGKVKYNSRAYIDLGKWSPGPRYTVAAWVNPEKIDTMRQTIVGGVSHCKDFGFNFNSGTFRGYLKNSKECTRDIANLDAPLAKIGTWYMVAITCNASHASFYLNGEHQETDWVLLNHIPTTAGFWIGKAICCSKDYFTGRIKTVKVWNHALEKDEINRSMYTMGTGNSTNEALHNGLVGHWELGESHGTPCTGNLANDHGGEDWNPKNLEEISGIHCNIGRFVVGTGVTVKIPRYNGTVGGVLDISAKEVVIHGYIDGFGAGYRGGVTSSIAGEGGRQGETYVGGLGDISLQNNVGGGGGGIGGNKRSDGIGRAGGGGGYGEQGSDGEKSVGDGVGLGTGGVVYGDHDLNVLYLGSGGGSGGNAKDLRTNPTGGRGGNGGGAVRIHAERSFKLTGVISVAGEPGRGDIWVGSSCMGCPDACDMKSPISCQGNSTSACWDMSGPGGGGSGGTVYISAKVVDIGYRKLWAMGGEGGAGGSHGCGGSGGMGRIRIDSDILQGTTGDTHGNVKNKTLADQYMDHSLIGQKQIDYTTTKYGNEVYRGCFNDNLKNRILKVQIPPTRLTSSQMTPDYCKELCRQRNFKFSGTKNGSLCFCDNHLDMKRKTDDSECTKKMCSGNPLWDCGNIDKVQVFGPPPNSPAIAHDVVTKCQPWCVTAGVNTASPKWGVCELGDTDEDSGTSWDIKCECPPGLTGSACDQTCPRWTYGNGCRRNCTCNETTTVLCTPNDGSCRCKPGYIGKDCNTQCPDGSFGENCNSTCNCQDRSVCDHVTGDCMCRGGWMGVNCNFPCPENKFGMNCTQTCPSCNHGTCSPIDGLCECYAGYKLPRCSEKCDRSHYGQDCVQKCDCNGSPCDPVFGYCKCGPGYSGPQCSRQCAHGYYGLGCQLQCQCKGSSSCHHVTGACNCGPGFLGAMCDETCPADKFGLECSLASPCVKNQTTLSDPATGSCKCLDGFYGNRCQFPCNPGYYGQNCRSKCRCKNGGFCSPTDGICTCADGFTGSTCQTSCQTSRYGRNCENTCPPKCSVHCNIVDGTCNCKTGRPCTCPNNTAGIMTQCDQVCNCVNGICNSKMSMCTCSAGWTGSKCDVACSSGKYGSGCTGSCTCQHGTCDVNNGTCICETGFMGTNCEQPCQVGTFGQNCSFDCPDCGAYSYPGCDTVTGSCKCSAGYLGALCDIPCQLGTYGTNCTQTCSCQNGGMCDNVIGKCTCAPGYQGDKCENQCSEGKWGLGCKHSCQCGPYGASCSHQEGVCKCKPGFIGAKCRESCPVGSWGLTCANKCECDPVSSVCSPVDGTCMCNSGYSGPDCSIVCSVGFWGRNCSQSCQCNNRGTCSPFSGQCACAAGYTGNTCEKQCDQDIYWGKDCMNLCSCNGAHCDHRDGTCRCPPGKIGHHCELGCDANHFGFQCAQLCGCQNGAKCNAVTGSCTCQPGWSGTFCGDPCPSGYYGVDCANMCPDCWNGGTCDTFTGACLCAADYTGSNCNTSLISVKHGASQQKQVVSSSGLQFTTGQFAGLIVGFIVLLIIVTVIVVFVSRKCSYGSFGRTSGAMKFNEEELDNTHFDTPPSTHAESGFDNPVHDPNTFEDTNVDQKSMTSETTSGIASATMDSDEEDNNYFKDSAA